MIEITTDTLEERIIKLLQKTYPITIADIERNLHVSRKQIEWMLQKFQVKGIVRLEPLPDKTYVRLLRTDFLFIGKKQPKTTEQEDHEEKTEKKVDYDSMMYS